MFKVTFKAPVTWLQPLCPAIPTTHTSSVDIYTFEPLCFFFQFFIFTIHCICNTFQILLYPANCYITFRFQFKCIFLEETNIRKTYYDLPSSTPSTSLPHYSVSFQVPLSSETYHYFILNNSFNNWNSFFFLQYKPMKSKAETVSITDLLKPSPEGGKN